MKTHYLISTSAIALQQLKLLLSNGMEYQHAYNQVLKATEPSERTKFMQASLKLGVKRKSNKEVIQEELRSLSKQVRKDVLAMWADEGFYSNKADA